MNDAAAHSLKLPLPPSLLGKFRRFSSTRGIDGLSDNRVVIARFKFVKNAKEGGSKHVSSAGTSRVVWKASDVSGHAMPRVHVVIN